MHSDDLSRTANDVIETTEATVVIPEASLVALNKIIIPRKYTTVAEHWTTEKVARPYLSVADHRCTSSYIVPRVYVPSEKDPCVACRNRCTCHEDFPIRYPRSIKSMHGKDDDDVVNTTDHVYGAHPSNHRFLAPRQMERETQTTFHCFVHQALEQ
jgi:hypothetical protein